MSIKFLAPLAVAALLATPAVAQARPSISMERVNRAATAYVVEQMRADNAAEIAYRQSPASAEELAAASAEGFGSEFGPSPLIVRASVEECSRESRFRAICDIEFRHEDGSVREDTLVYVVMRRGSLLLV